MMSNLVAHAEHELGRIRGEPGDDMQAAMNAHLLAMVRLFADEGHSGFSASYAVSALERLLRFHPLTPLTGEPDEWTEVWDGCWQNRRCGHVFKDESGAYDSQGIIFRDPDGSTWQGAGSRVYITFPYTPGKPQIVDRPPTGDTK